MIPLMNRTDLQCGDDKGSSMGKFCVKYLKPYIGINIGRLLLVFEPLMQKESDSPQGWSVNIFTCRITLI